MIGEMSKCEPWGETSKFSWTCNVARRNFGEPKKDIGYFKPAG